MDEEVIPLDELPERIAQLERERDAEHVRAEQAYANYVQLMRDVADERNATAETVARLERDRDRAQDTVLQQHRRAEAAERYLGTMLAVILSDGGHRQAEVGTDQAVDEALGKYHGLLARAESAEAQVAELRRELDELHATFDAQWAADMRAVARWRAEDPERRALSMPDREAMTFRLLQLLDAAEAQVAELRAALQLVQQELDDVEQDGSEIAFSDGERDIIRAALAGTPAEALARQQALARVVAAARMMTFRCDGRCCIPSDGKETAEQCFGWQAKQALNALAALDGGARDE